MLPIRSELLKLRRTIEFGISKISKVLSSTTYTYDTVWDVQVDHEELDIHAITIEFNQKTNGFEMWVIDIDTEQYCQWFCTENIVQYYDDVWEDEFIESEYRNITDEETHFQISTIKDVLPLEYILLFSEMYQQLETLYKEQPYD